MIISHKHKFIFIKTKKTAGTSFEIGLSRFLGDEDVVTRITPKDEEIRAGLGYAGPRNFHVPFTRFSLRDCASLLMGKRPAFTSHIPAWYIKSHIGREVWDSYYKFCFDRNPWDKVISYYYWRYKTEPRPTLEQVVMSGELEAFQRTGGFGIYSFDGKLAVNDVYRYEDMEDSLRKIEQRIGLDGQIVMPMAKAGYRKEKAHYSQLMSPQMIDEIARIFRSEIALLGYEKA